MLDQKRIGELISRLRKERGLTQSALADLLCVTHQAVSKWESGSALPDVEVLVAMRGVFGLSVDDILNARMPSPETADAPASKASDGAGANERLDTITEDTIVVFGDRTFESPVAVDSCVIFGQAHFRADMHSDTLEVMGRGSFEGSVTVDSLGISGAANISRGIQADSVVVRGELVARGGLSCDNLENSGATNCGGGVNCDSMRNAGAFTIGGGIAADALYSSGVMTIGGGISADSVDNSGMANIGGGVTSDAFVSSGDLTLGGGLKADSVRLSGRFRFGGGMSATSVSVTLEEQDCACHGIHAESVMVKSDPNHPGGVLTVREIIADHAELSYVHSDLIKVQTGRIGDGCKIARLECGPEVEILPSAEITEIQRLPGD